MASTFQFGLSLDPLDGLQRHCFYDSDEEQDEEKVVQCLDDLFIAQTSTKVPVKILIMATSRIGCHFLSSHVTTESKPCVVVKTLDPLKVIKGKYFSDEGEETTDKEMIISSIYRVKDKEGVFICLNETPLKEEYCNYWSKKLLDIMNPQCVVCIHSLPLLSYYGNEQDDSISRLLKGLVTLSWAHEPLAEPLPPANVVSAEPAAIMTHCQLRGVPAAMASLYSSSSLTSREQVQFMRPLLSHPLLIQLLTLNDFQDADRRLSSLLSLVENRQEMNSLYT